jgi:hypothetical protein
MRIKECRIQYGLDTMMRITVQSAEIPEFVLPKQSPGDEPIARKFSAAVTCGNVGGRVRLSVTRGQLSHREHLLRGVRSRPEGEELVEERFACAGELKAVTELLSRLADEIAS